MIKFIIAAVVLVGVGVAIYYGRFLFTKKVVREEVPVEMRASSRSLREGSFENIDFIHKGSGRALILEDANGHKLLRFENLEVTNGPDLYVYLSRNPRPTKDKDSLGDFINLGRLKGNVGDQNYELTQNSDGYQSVVIWCRQFNALFSFATLR